MKHDVLQLEGLSFLAKLRYVGRFLFRRVFLGFLMVHKDIVDLSLEFHKQSRITQRKLDALQDRLVTIERACVHCEEGVGDDGRSFDTGSTAEDR